MYLFSFAEHFWQLYVDSVNLTSFFSTRRSSDSRPLAQPTATAHSNLKDVKLPINPAVLFVMTLQLRVSDAAALPLALKLHNVVNLYFFNLKHFSYTKWTSSFNHIITLLSTWSGALLHSLNYKIRNINTENSKRHL